MSLISVVGLPNSGKSYYMTVQLFKAWISGRTLLTNYDLGLIPHYIINQDWLLSLVQEQHTIIENVTIGLDELWIWLADSRKATSKYNTIASYFFLQSSKDDSDIFYTAQDNGQNDVRLRNNENKIIECDRVIYHPTDKKFYPINDEKRFLNKKYGQWIMDYLYVRAIVYKSFLQFGILKKKYSHTEYLPMNFIKLYETQQKIRPVVK